MTSPETKALEREVQVTDVKQQMSGEALEREMQVTDVKQQNAGDEAETLTVADLLVQ